MGAAIGGKDNGNFCPLVINPSKLKGIAYDINPNEAHIKSPVLISGLYADGETMIRKSQSIDIAYPEFFSILSKL